MSLSPITAQLLLNSGVVWKVEGHVGKSAVEHLTAGRVMLGPTRHTDCWGNPVPSRYDIKEGRGSRAYVVEMMGEDYAQQLDLLPTDPDASVMALALFR
jgi:hypothetical protein